MAEVEQDSQGLWADTLMEEVNSDDELLRELKELRRATSPERKEFRPKTRRYKPELPQEDTLKDVKRTMRIKHKGDSLVAYVYELQDEIEELLQEFKRRNRSYLKAVNNEDEANSVIAKVDEIFQEIHGSVKGSMFDFRNGIIGITEDAVIVKAFD